MEKEELSGQRYKPLLVPILYETDEEMIHARTVREIQIASNFAVLKSSRKDDMTIPSSAKRMKLATNDKEQQQYNLAIETAVLVQKEIEQWENSIRELEIILSRSESQILPTAPPHHHHHHHRCPSTHRSVVPDTSDAHGTTIDTITVKDDTTTTTTTHHHRHNSNDDAPIIPHRSISVSSTETRVAVIDEDDMTSMVVPVDTSTPPENVVWETTAAAAVSLSSASSSST